MNEDDKREEGSRTLYLELGEELMRSRGGDDDVAGGGSDEAFVHGLVDERQERVVVPVHVQQSHLRSTTRSGYTSWVPFPVFQIPIIAFPRQQEKDMA